MTFHLRIIIILSVALGCMAGLFMLPPIAEDPAYHHFADNREWLGIPNFGDVMSNAFFFFMGALGLAATAKRRTNFKTPEYLAWTALFTGIFLTGFGSSYYHLSPDNNALAWDRLPMTIAFMSLFSLIIMERVSSRAGILLFPLLLAAGLLSVWYWIYTENLGHGDLRPYALVQFLPLVEILLILGLFPAGHTHTRYLFYTLGFYVMAKVLERFDPQVFALLGHAVSGHTLKHLVAGGGVWWIIKYMKGAGT